MERSAPGGVGRLVLVTLLVAGAWLGVYALFTQVFPDDTGGVSTYRYRDDALITLSHARGLVDVGTVSVSVSGARVEGYSTPLQFGLAAAYYRLGGDGHQGFLDVQVALSTLVLGAAVFVLLRVAAPRRPMLVTTAVALGIAVGLFATFAFFGWHSSGMENALTNALAAAAVAALALALAVGRTWTLPVAGVVVALFALGRAEFVFHAAPLLVVASAFLLWRSSERRWQRLALLVGPAVGIWLAVLLARFWYFGSLAPNTAEAQRISPGDNLRAWTNVLWPLLAPVVYVAVSAVRSRRIEVRAIARAPVFWGAAGVGVATAGLLTWRADVNSEVPGVDALLSSARILGAWWWLALVGALALLVWPRLGPVEALLATLVVTGTFHVLVFGPARLAGERVVTFVLVPLACLAGALALRFDAGRVFAPSIRTRLTVACLTGAAGLMLIAAWSAWSNHDTWGAQQPLCCDVTPTIERTLAEAASIERRTELPVVSVANADLGLLSIQKQVNITDLAGLGDPLLARVWRRGYETGRVDVAVDYLNHYASPDVVELHGVWSCGYAPWQSSEDFRAAYQKVWDDGWTAAWAREGCPGVEGVDGGIWVRTDLQDTGSSPEVALSRKLARDPDPATVRRALAECESATVWSCQHVTRSVYRNLRTFEAAGTLDETIAAFDDLPSAAYDQAVLRSRTDGDWHEQAADWLFDPD
ncbi:MAG: hypothetical protein H0V95_09745 [Actinobacteria bacterium]|nr:hypothetical protein [Actinomycetota bacterium]